MRVIVPEGSSVTANSDCVTSDYVTGDVDAMKVAEGVTGAGVSTTWTLISPVSVQERVLNVVIRIMDVTLTANL